jgi:replicative DNA helicase
MSELEAEREPIQANDAEVSLIGAALSGYPHLDDLFAIVEAKDFYHPFNGQVWDAVERVHRAGNKPDVVTVRFALDATDLRYDPLRLVDMAGLCPTPTSAPYYAEKVSTAAGLRAITTAAVKIHQVAERAVDIDQAREDARQVIDDATHGRTVTKARTIADVLPAVIDTAEQGQTSLLGTGWADLDRHLGGFAPGRLVLFAARPGIGKSVAGVNLALHFAAHHKHAVLLASLEMPEHEVGQRMLAAWANVNLTNLASGNVGEKDWDQIARKSQALADLPITITDQPHQTVTDLRRQARDIQRTRDDLALIVVDYLQLVKPSVKTNNRAEAVTDLGLIHISEPTRH